MRKVHFIGIGGVGMAGLALLVREQGADVSGCDVKASPRTRWLEAQGIRVAIGHSPDHLTAVDEVVMTPAVRPDEPERAALRSLPVAVRFRGEVLSALANARETIAVCGSHGKTTTATWIAKLLRALGEDAAWCIGGETGDFPVAGVGKGPLVIEADESDGTLALYRARTLVVNRCDYDHPDHFKTEADYFACYETAKRQAQDVIASESLPPLPELEALPLWNRLAPHNRKNARAAVEVALRRGHALDDILSHLPGAIAVLPDRRFQHIAPEAEATTGKIVVTDYAHHPTEMACAVAMARQICRGMLRVLFQPHRYSRTKALLGSFPSAFAGADEVILCPTYAAFEKPIEGGDIADLYAETRAAFAATQSKSRLYLAPSRAAAWEHAANTMRTGDVTLLLGAGDIIDLVPQVRADLVRTTPMPKRRIVIGAGTNTWRSDLSLNVAYATTTSPAGRPGATLGIPWMVGIPGTIGGWVKMNAGAFGHSISEALEAVKVDGRWIPAADCGFGYRTSAIAGVIEDIRLKPDATSAAFGTAAEFLSRRRKFPSGTFGSFFKNPPNDFAGRLLEAAGAKELRVGGAFVWREHANVIVRGEGATPSDVLALSRLMALRVWYRFGIRLEPEVRLIPPL